MDPRLEAVRIPKVRKPPPGKNEGVLQRVLGQTRVAQDPMSDGKERIADLVHQDGECLAITRPGPLDEVSIHLVPSGGVAAEMTAITHYDGRVGPKRSESGEYRHMN